MEVGFSYLVRNCDPISGLFSVQWLFRTLSHQVIQAGLKFACENVRFRLN
jgi:hypothetical protein